MAAPPAESFMTFLLSTMNKYVYKYIRVCVCVGGAFTLADDLHSLLSLVNI